MDKGFCIIKLWCKYQMAYQTSQQQKEEIKVNRYTHFQGRQFCENGFSEKKGFLQEERRSKYFTFRV